MNRVSLNRIVLLVVVLVLTAIIFQSQTDVYLSQANFRSVLRAMSMNGIVALGLTFVIVLRKFDLSLVGIASLAAMSLGFAIEMTNSLWLSAAFCLLIGLLLGAANGFFVGRLHLPDVVTTIAIGSIAGGLAFFYNDGATFSRNFFSSGIVMLNAWEILGLQAPVFILLVTAILSFILLHTTRLGQAFYAVGENDIAARFSGISVAQASLLCFSICGMLTALAMVLQISGIGSARVTAGAQILLPAYTSVYLGAAFFGRASVPATLVGVLVMTLLLNGFTLLSVPYYYSDVVVSAILISAILLFDPRFAAFVRQLRRPTKGDT